MQIEKTLKQLSDVLESAPYQAALDGTDLSPNIVSLQSISTSTVTHYQQRLVALEAQEIVRTLRAFGAVVSAPFNEVCLFGLLGLSITRCFSVCSKSLCPI